MKMERRKRLTALLSAVLALVLVFSMAGCGSSDKDAEEQDAQKTEQNVQIADLSGKSLFVYCGAGMKKPMTEIVENFKTETGCEVDMTFGNAAQIISQITNSNQGDVFIAGSEVELKKLEEKELIAGSEKLVKHIPVIAVPKGNPAGIKSIEDLGNGAKLIFGDAESTPIGKVADKVLKEAGIMEKANIIARAATNPEAINVLATGEADASIVWKENVKDNDKLEIIEAEGMENYINIIPAASLSCAANEESLEAFIEYLGTDAAKEVWENNGYEIAE